MGMLAQNDADAMQALDIEMLEAMDGLLFAGHLERVDSDWFRKMNLDVPKLITLKNLGFIGGDFDDWYPYLRDHFWGVRRNNLDLFVRFVLPKERLLFVTAYGEHSLNGHAPDNFALIANDISGLSSVEIYGERFYFSSQGIPQSHRNNYFNHVMKEVDRVFEETPCVSHSGSFGLLGA